MLNTLSIVTGNAGIVKIHQYYAVSIQILILYALLEDNPKMDGVQHFEKKSEYPSNKNFEKQHRLVSTKKKETKRSKLRLKKPNSDDNIRLVNELSTYTAKVCALCFSVSDKMGSSSSEFS